ncbi:MAG: GTPase HflX [Actinobacteria bacterium]|nr:GTPase HflX [Actinomycetota bacterium]
MTKEKAILVFVYFDRFGKNRQAAGGQGKKTVRDYNMEELKNLASGAGAAVDECMVFRQDRPNPKYFITSGKLEKVKNRISGGDISLIIFDDEITPTQQGSLQKELNVKVLDRTALILDIFAQRAHSSEGKLQVELAQLNYLMPRLVGKGIELSRLGGGIGTRGPGETKLEVDRRKIRKRIGILEKKIKQLSVQRKTRRKKRAGDGIFQVALVGYTNSGKSTLLNSVTDAGVYVKDMLFSTLDSTTRKVKIDLGKTVLFSDTVGFIEKLPHQLIAAFKSTLEEVIISDLLLLIVDISNDNYESNILSVKKVLKEIDAWGKDYILVFNKIDKIPDELLEKTRKQYTDAVFISALEKTGISGLFDCIRERVEKHYIETTLKVPYGESRLISFIYDNFRILERKDTDENVILTINLDPEYASSISNYIYRGKKTPKKLD